MDLQSLYTDHDKEVAGAWVRLDEDTELKIARLYNERFLQRYNELVKPGEVLANDNTLAISSERADNIMGTLIADSILLDWRGLTQGGEPIEYSKEKVIEIWTDDRCREFRRIVMEASQNLENYRLEEIDKAVGESEAGSGGGTNGDPISPA